MALLKILSFDLCFQEIVLASTIRLLLSSSPQHPRQASSFKLLLSNDSSKPLKMARQVGCYDYCLLFQLQPFYFCFLLPVSAQLVR